MMHETINMQVPATIYHHLKERAAAAQRSVEDEVSTIVTAAIADDALPADLEAALAALETADDATLWHTARTSMLSRAESDEIEQLHFKRQRGQALTAQEQQRLDDLMERYDWAMLLRAQAAALLKGRGHDVNVLLQRP
jgi:plasmid stability protein